jgi:hypothetical protein
MGEFGVPKAIGFESLNFYFQSSGHYSYVKRVFGLYSTWIDDWVRSKGTEKTVERERASE